MGVTEGSDTPLTAAVQKGRLKMASQSRSWEPGRVLEVIHVRSIETGIGQWQWRRKEAGFERQKGESAGLGEGLARRREEEFGLHIRQRKLWNKCPGGDEGKGNGGGRGRRVEGMDSERWEISAG